MMARDYVDDDGDGNDDGKLKNSLLIHCVTTLIANNFLEKIITTQHENESESFEARENTLKKGHHAMTLPGATRCTPVLKNSHVI